MPYLSPTEYLERFGEPETIRLTDQTKAGQVDVPKLETAIADQCEFADSYLAGRYALPISAPPELLKKIVADLTREALHGTRPTDTVTQNADRARSLLKDLAAGRASIPAPPGGVEPVGNPDDVPAIANDRRARVFTDAALSDFTSFGASYGGTVFDGPRGW